MSRIFLLYIVLIDPFISFLNISTLSFKKLFKTKSLILYFFFINNSLLNFKDLNYSLISLFNRVLKQKINIQVYKQIIISIIKEFILEKLNTITLLLKEDKNLLYNLVISQMNHSINVKDFNYGRSNLIFNNINSNLQFKYLQFYLRYFNYFKLNNIDLPLDSYRSKLRILNNLKRDFNLNIINSLIVKYIRSNSLINNTNRKHNKQASFISSILSPALKRVKTQDLISLNNLHLTFITTLISIL